MGATDRTVVSDREVTPPPRNSNRERSKRTARNKTLRELLQGLQAIDSGDFRTRLTPNGDPESQDEKEPFSDGDPGLLFKQPG